MTTHAQGAASIRKELKTAFPNIKFSVRSSSFAGGNSVAISYEDGVPSSEVEKIVRKYQYGSFDGMTDSYTADNVRNDLPQTKYVQVSRSFTKETRESVKDMIQKEFGLKDFADETVMKALNVWPDQAIWMRASKMTF